MYQLLLLLSLHSGHGDNIQTVSEKLLVTHDTCKICIPQNFRPGVDADFQPGGPAVKSFRMKVFNRWGVTVFEGKKDEAWDGKYKDAALPAGTYYFEIHILTIDGEKLEKVGTLNLFAH